MEEKIGRLPNNQSALNRANYCLSSEVELEGKLNQSRVVHRVCDRSKRRVERLFDSSNSPRRKVGVRQSELGMVKQIEELCPEVSSHALSEKSVFTNPGPERGVLEAVPNSPTGAWVKQAVLNHC